MQLGLATGVALLGALVSITSCSGRPPIPAPEPPHRPTALPAGSNAPKTSPSGRAPALVELAASESVTLAPEVKPVASRRSALLVHSDLLRAQSYVRRIDSQHQMGDVKVLAGRQLADAIELASGTLLVSSTGSSLCVETFSSAPVCHAARADFAVAMAGKPVLVEQREEPLPPEDADKPKPKPAKGAHAPVAKPIKVRVWIHELDATGNKVGDAIDSGLAFEMPQPGMGVVDAAGSKRGLWLLFYEHARPLVDGKRLVQQARLRAVELDKTGKVVARTKKTLYEGDRRFGFIEGHVSPRLFGSDGAPVMIGRFSDTTQPKTPRVGFEAKRVAPLQEVKAPDAVFAVDPLRLASSTMVNGTELAAMVAISNEAPRLVAGQAATDPGRVAWVGDRGYFLKEGKLTSAHRVDGAVRAEAEPFVARRSRMFWGELEPDGAGLALTNEGLVEITSDGSVAKQASSIGPAALGRPVKIGASWWISLPRGGTGSGGAITRLLPSSLEASALSDHAFLGAHTLVGGATAGMMVALSRGRLAIWQLAEDGTTKLLAEHDASVGPGFDAVARGVGGAIVVGRTAARTARALAFAADGTLVGQHDISIASKGQLTIAARPGGGAWVLDAGRSEVAWLDDHAHELASTSWPASATEVACVDGAPTRTTVPSPEPGKIEDVGKLAGTHCVATPLPAWVDGGLRWLGTEVDGIDSRAVLATLSGPNASPQTEGSAGTPPAAAALPARSPCPADMVSIQGSFCIDRYETQLVEADGVPLSPDYPATAGILKHVFSEWAAGRWTTGDLHARAMSLPPLLRAADHTPQPVARSRFGVRPSGYQTWHVASAACLAAGKRLCKHNEWLTACRGEQNRTFPYGDDFQHGKCNVHRFAHPAASLHGNAAVGHLDPRLNRVLEAGAPLLRTTGATPSCASRWGDDAVYDMVGNLDEWIDHKKGAFAGGFFSRSTKSGCDALITAHPKQYLDYSLGTRCCLDP